jgi:zinc transport system ATP-binding protein
LTAADRDAALAMSHGGVALGGSYVLHDIDFHLPRGQFVVLLGANGSGKTTLVRALLGLVPLARGRVEIFGVPLHRFRDWKRIGYVPQRITATSPVPATALEIVLSGRAAHTGLWRRYGPRDIKAALTALEAVDLLEHVDDPVAVLSGGQQQRVLIARALAGDPDVLLLDEPVASVDLSHQESFARVLGDLNRHGTAILLVAHALGAMAPLAHRSVVLERGGVIHDGPPLRGAPHEEHQLRHHHHPETELHGERRK